MKVWYYRRIKEWINEGIRIYFIEEKATDESHMYNIEMVAYIGGEKKVVEYRATSYVDAERKYNQLIEALQDFEEA